MDITQKRRNIISIAIVLYFFVSAYHIHVAYLVIATGLLGLICSLSATIKTTFAHNPKKAR